ncbi:hypothetical protein ATE48_12880 [Candidatus Viadribacter manganicus]|uniref:Uncharacterized protein n=1 Tax=Candidatus Viadribacter manganicus TaxID=1759059 RepID=A0A1B1AJL6_9PROT|nr:hypothetical protein ATE48_12880 [Candidatus Viadribacter manganicus]
MGHKITIGEARSGGADGLIVNCIAAPTRIGGCRHSSTLTMMLAIALWGEDRRLDDLRLRCSCCGSRRIEIRPDYDNRPGRGT